MPPFMFSFRPIRGSSDEERSDRNEKEQDNNCIASSEILHQDVNSANAATKHAESFKHVIWQTQKRSRRSLEHSFSDVSQFDINLTMKPVKPKGLRADFVHLHGVGLENTQATANLHEENEGFQLRSIKRSISSLESDRSAKDRAIGTKTIVVVPSIDLDVKELKRMCDCIECYEERQLYHLLLTNDPSVRVIFLTSNHVEEKVIRYYLNLCRDEDTGDQYHQSDQFSNVHAKLTRVFVISVPSKKYVTLSDKILEDKKLVEFVKSLIHQRKNPSPADSAGLSVFSGSDSIDRLSHELGIRLLESSEDHLHYGTKQGSREIFAACGIPHPVGTPSDDDDDLLTYGDKQGEPDACWADNHRYIRSSRSLAIGISRQIIMRGVNPRKWMVKLNQGFSGKGNASIDLTKFQGSNYSPTGDIEKDVLDMAEKVEKELAQNLKYEDSSMTWHGDTKYPGFQKQIESLGVIAEAFIEGEVPTSPSIQVVLEPNDDESVGGRVSIVSTHEQLLHGQVFHGCINPASQQYRAQIMEIGLKVGRYMAARGVVGHFSCDFIATKNIDGTWNLNAVEINLRQGGTTHPHANMALLCGGCICDDGVFRTNDNEVRTYIATDHHLMKPCSENELIDAIESKTDPLAHRIRWNKEDRVGVVFHLFKFAKIGRIGFTAIGRSIEESQLLFDRTVEFLSHFSAE